MNYLHRKIFRDLWEIKWRSLLIISSIACAIGPYGGFYLSEENILASVDRTYNELNYEDAAFNVFGYANQEIFNNLSTEIDNIAAIESRISVSSVITTNGRDFNGQIIGINRSRRPLVNDFKFFQGEYFSPNGFTDVIIEKHFSKRREIDAGDKITVHYGNFSVDLNVIGVVFSPEYKYAVNPNTGLPEVGNFCPIWVPLEILQTLLEEVLHLESNLVNELLIRVNDKDKLDETITQVKSYLSNKGVEVSTIRGDEELDHLMMEADVGMIGDFGLAIGLISLIVAVFIIYDSLLKLVVAQRKIIGVMRALGATKWQVVNHYLKYGIILTVLGSILSIPIGFLFLLMMNYIYIALIGIPYVTVVFRIEPFILPITIGFISSAVGSFIAAYQSANILPMETMSGATVTASFSKAGIVEKVTEKIIKKNKYTIKIPIRHVFNRKKRTILSTITIALSMLMIITSLGSLDSILYQIDVYYDENLTYDLEGQLINPMNETIIQELVEKIERVDMAVGMVREQVSISTENENVNIFLGAYPEGTSVRNYHYKEGDLKKGQIIIGSITAKNLNLSLNDKISIATIGAEEYVNDSFIVSGILNEFIEIEIFMHLKDAQSFLGMGSNVSSVAIIVEKEANREKITKELMSKGLFTTIQDVKKTKESIEKVIQGLQELMYLIAFAGVITLFVFSLNVIVLDIIERENEFVNLRTGGATLWTIAKIIGLQILIITVAVLILQGPIGYYSTEWINQEVIAKVFYVTTYLKPITYVITSVSLIIGLGAGVLISIRHAMKISLLLITRIRFQT